MTWLEAARRIVERSTFEVLDPNTCEPVPYSWQANEDESSEDMVGDGVLLDLYSASVMVQIHDALGEENRAKFAAMPLTKAHSVAFKLAAKVGS